MKDILKFTGKLTLIFILISFFSFVALLLVIGSDLDDALKVVAGLLLIVFMTGMLWDTCVKHGVKDCKATLAYRRGKGSKEQSEEARRQMFYPAKGFIAGAIPMIIPAAATVVCTAAFYRGWENTAELVRLGESLYQTLFYVFIAYTPALVLATPVCSTQAFSFGVYETFADYSNVHVGNMIMPYMFFVPIAVFILTCGICYIMGFNSQKQLVPAHVRDKYFPPKGTPVAPPEPDEPLEAEPDETPNGKPEDADEGN